MKIAYTHEGRAYTLKLGRDGKWTGGDPITVLRLNAGLTEFLGYAGYYRITWDRAKAVADELGGMLDTPEPKRGPIDPNVVY
jgi:hypothetical protein